MYSNNSLEIEARSIDIKDIESQMNETGIRARDAYSYENGLPKYGNTRTHESGNNEYPNLYAKENGSGINTETVKTDGIDVNEDGYIIPTTETSSTANEGLTVTQTYYGWENISSRYFDNSEVYNMIFGTEKYYWLASRCVNCVSTSTRFGLFYVGKSDLSDAYLFYTNGTDYYIYAERLRPVVSLGADIQITPVENADGSSPLNMHQISKK